MSIEDVSVQESSSQKMVHTAMDGECLVWLNFIHGGVNFEVEHHLFPRLPRHNLYQVQPSVKELCDAVCMLYINIPVQAGIKKW